VTKRYRIQEFY